MNQSGTRHFNLLFCGSPVEVTVETQSAKVTEVSREATHAQAQTKHMMNIEVLLKGEVTPTIQRILVLL